MQVKIFPSQPRGTLRIPSSKSIAHRAILCACLAEGTSLITHVDRNRDVMATIACMKALGADIRIKEEGIEITGTNGAGLSSDIVCPCDESGSTLRFVLPLASLSRQKVTFTGRGRLMQRPMDVYQKIFEEQSLSFVQKDSITIQGALQAGRYELPGDVSSQFITGLLMACPLMKEDSTIIVRPPFESRSYVDLTLSVLADFGITVEQKDNTFFIKGNQQYQPRTYSVEGDDSQMAFFATWAALNQPLQLKGCRKDSLQGDHVICSLLEQAGAKVTQTEAFITIQPGSGQAIQADLGNCPDLGPILFVLASYLTGTSTFTSIRRLRLKESDRVAAMEEELRKWGVQIQSQEDRLTITGKETYRSDSVVTMHSHNDHRIAMAMTVFGLCAQSPSCLLQAEAVNKSYPEFFKDIQKLQGKVETI
ncbi:MAG: 3-phosphoshikimate 1-carboxyvinyltransferase [Erysipelotrichaceae bacterium]|nr:3-phosphoshikimate 1-carboxyvinyltransferase [Erysipelotrichaceae bacterium]